MNPLNYVGFKRRNNPYGKNSRSKPKLAIAGAISLVIGILLVQFIGVPALHNQGKMDDNPALTVGMLCIIGGVMMLLFSLSKKRQRQVVRGLDVAKKTFDDNCNCCKCTNCDRDHNHWTH